MRSRPRQSVRINISTGRQFSFVHTSQNCREALVCTAVWQSCAQVLEKVLPLDLKPIASIFWVELSDQLWLLLAWSISLAWLLDCYQDSSLCQGQGAQRVASAYGWVTIVILSMVKRAHSSRLWAHTSFIQCNC